jgi:4-hydroxybenzoate polyprenyltransferase
LASIEHLVDVTKVVSRVLCVDLDGSLLSTDLLYETFVAFLRKNPLELWKVFVWVSQGKAQLKRRLAELDEVDVRLLPLNEEVLAFLRRQREAGQRLVLATAAEESLARAVADHLGLFDEVIASDSTVNLKGPAKLRAIESRFGPGGFEYVGNGWEDLPIWESAGAAIAVQPSARLLREIQSRRIPCHVFECTEGAHSSWPKLLRIHQWAKNLLLFVPLLMAHRVGEWPLVLASMVAFLAFSFGASSIYILNDLIDLTSDRMHPRKRFRPLASGRISIRSGLAACTLLLGTSIALAAFRLPFLKILLLYLTTSTAYTFILKKKLMIDVLCLAGLYTLRIVAGGAVTGIPISTWLMAFSMFLFLSLAFVKRYTELAAQSTSRGDLIHGRNYRAIDLDMVRSVGPASGYIAVLVICLYLNDRESIAVYRHPNWLLLLCPVILYWISRVWFLAQRGQMHSDPVVFALRDQKSLIAGIVCAAIIAAATWL